MRKTLRNGDAATGSGICRNDGLMLFGEIGNRSGARPMPIDVAPTELLLIFRDVTYKYFAPTERSRAEF
jgi:hypothetical protein